MALNARRSTIISCVLVFSFDLVFCQFRGSSDQQDSSRSTPCYDDTGKPQRCIPEFGNAAYDVLVDATNTCGVEKPTEYCTQASTPDKSCSICYVSSYPPSHLTDVHNKQNQTWWQSETMLENVQYPSQVNLTLHLRKAYDITYVRLLFYSPRPESFTIYKRTKEDGPWIPYHYYSSSCRDIYGLPNQPYARVGDEARALCTSEYSEMTPLTGGNVPFSTLEGRPSAYHFDSSPELQDWVTATDIRIALDRLHTFGDELWGDPQVLKSYFYAISDLAVGARCKCNGHASECPVVGPGWQRVCRCEHNTAGPDCNECLPFYNDLPWGRATQQDAHECKACNCNGFSNRCFFDNDLYLKTGHGGHCLDCRGNRDGPNCERCKENYFQQEGSSYCIACNCNDLGSRSRQCNSEGKCQCKPGVTGDKCDKCQQNHYDFSRDGCKGCECSPEGSLNNQLTCDPVTGTCLCKENVEGRRCRECIPGFFNLDKENEYGCTPCFCYGQTSTCRSAPGYSKVTIESMFSRGIEKWSGEDVYGRPVPVTFHAVTQSLVATAPSREPVYFLASDRFLGDQRASYNQDLEFKLRLSENTPEPTPQDVILEGSGLTISQTIFGQDNPLPSTQATTYKFRLHENTDHGWQPRLLSRDFMSVLANLTAIKIRGTYTSAGVGHLDDVRLKSARRGAAGQAANWIEMCSCPSGYVGQFCESCAPGFRHEPPNGGPFARCVKCNCNGHADICDPDTGRCICQHNTGGDNCERCDRGYYGNALAGGAFDCKLCPCPNNGACMQLADDTVVCLDCPVGYGGSRCDHCSDGYFGDPTGSFGSVRLCQPCDCNTNVDSNAVGNCNRTTGECLKCIYNTGGPQCDQCLPGYYGDALAVTKGDCKPCQCYRAGTMETESGPPMCDQLNGQCQCKPHVLGTNCDTCEDGYFNIVSGDGCESCNCDPIGSLDRTCDISSGQCHCRPGISGLRCDVCVPYSYGFSTEGCKPCDCDGTGSTSLQCDANGQCPCFENVEGRRCDRCKENKFDRHRGCVDCPPCYNLVQDAVNEHRRKLQELQKVLSDIASSPTVIDDLDFERKLEEVDNRILGLSKDVQHAIGDGISERLEELHQRLNTIRDSIKETEQNRIQADAKIEQGISNVTYAEGAIDRAKNELQQALEYLQTDGATALKNAVEKSDQFGQQNQDMAKISQEARFYAQNQEKEVERIKQIADKALNISTSAYDITKDAISSHQSTKDELRTFDRELGNVATRLQRANERATLAQAEAERVQTETLNIYQDIVNLKVPETDVQQLRQDSEIITSQSKKIKSDAERLKEDHDSSWADLKENIENNERLLEAGDTQRDAANALMAEVDAANVRATQAVELLRQKYEEAKENYQTLSDFERRVEDSKEKARNALGTIPSITEQIEDAESRTNEAQRALSGAEQNAIRARDTAQEAQTKYAEQASMEAHKVKSLAEETKTQASNLLDDAGELATSVALTENRLKNLEETADKNEALINEAKEKVGQTKGSVTDVSKQVQKALENVTSILDELNDLEDIDENQLDELEALLSNTDAEVKGLNLDERLQSLKEAKVMQTQWLKNYQDEVGKLRLEVENIQAIHDSLPEGCFMPLKLEP